MCFILKGSGVRIVLGRDKRSVKEHTKLQRIRRKREVRTDKVTLEDEKAILTFNYLIAGMVKII